MNIKQCKYQLQDSEMTLREGIDEYHKANPHLLVTSNLDAEAAEFFLNHDNIHVVFGCNTSLPHEFRADFWTIFGSDVGFLKYASYLKSTAVQALLKDAKERAA